MAARADSPSPWAAGLGLRGLWRLGLVGGVTAAVVMAWALLGPADAPPVVSIVSEAPVLQRAPVAVVEAEPVDQPANETAVVAEPIATAVPATSESDARPAAVAAPAVWPPQSGIIPGRPDPVPPRRPARFERYVVQPGESLALIANVRGVTLADLRLFNSALGDGSVLAAGASIWIPIWEAADDDAP